MATGTGKTYIQIYLAICALLTGTQRPIVIVTPQMQLVKQAYQDFINLLKALPEPLISAAQILKVDSDHSSISSQLLIKTSTLKDKCFAIIVCQDSYEKILDSTDPGAEIFKFPAMLLIDEFHLSPTLITKFKSREGYKENALIAGLSATPSEQLNEEDDFLSVYSRKMAVADGQLAPFVLGRFPCNYHRKNVSALIDNMPHLLNNHLMPDGQRLVEQKGIIYVPYNDDEIDYSSQLKMVLEEAGILCFEINADQPDYKKNLESFKKCATPTKILICKNMAKVGFSDNEINWVIYLQNGSAEQFCQSVGRAMRRWPNHPNKIAYGIAFHNVDTRLVFEAGNTCDIQLPKAPDDDLIRYQLQEVIDLDEREPKPKRHCVSAASIDSEESCVSMDVVETTTPPSPRAELIPFQFFQAHSLPIANGGAPNSALDSEEWTVEVLQTSL